MPLLYNKQFTLHTRCLVEALVSWTVIESRFEQQGQKEATFIRIFIVIAETFPNTDKIINLQ